MMWMDGSLNLSKQMVQHLGNQLSSKSKNRNDANGMNLNVAVIDDDSASNYSIDSSVVLESKSYVDNVDYQTEAINPVISKKNRKRSKGDKKNTGAIGQLVNLKFWGAKESNDYPSSHDDDGWIENKLKGETGPRRFKYKALANATNNFSSQRVIGKGGFGHVYEGKLKGEDIRVAIKKLDQATPQGTEQYLSEIKILTKLRHRNLIELIGWCHEKGDLLLVYEFIPNGNLCSHLHSDSGSSLPGLDWKTRYKIISDLASALLYLHEEWSQCVLHRDIKPTNIMLDMDFNPRLVDFGLAWIMDHGSVEVKTGIAGTPGYLAPECTIDGTFSQKTDVYSFGVVALEVACGITAAASNEEENYKLVETVWDSYRMGNLLDVVDERLEGSFDIEQMGRLMLVGLWCTLPDTESRPLIRQAKRVLEFEDPPPILPGYSPFPTYPRMSTISKDSSSPNTDSTNQTYTESNAQDSTHVRTPFFKMPEIFGAKKDAQKTGKNKNAANAKRATSPSNVSDDKNEVYHEYVNGPVASTNPAETSGEGSQFDIGIPANYESTGPMQAYQIEIINGFARGLAEIIRTQPQIDDVMESVRKFTSLLVSFGAPLDDWSSLALYVLQAVKDIEALKAELKLDDEVFETLTSLQKEYDECTYIIEVDNAEMIDSRQRLASAQQERVRLMAESVELQKRLANLRKRIKDAEDSCSALQESVTNAEERIAEKVERMEWLKGAVASTAESLETKKATRQEKEDSISSLITSMLSRISSFSCSC